MLKVKTGNGYKDIDAVYSGSTPIETIYDRNGFVVFSAGTELEGVSPLTFIGKKVASLNNYRVFGNVGGVGDKTNNIWNKSLVDDYSSNSSGQVVQYEGRCSNREPVTVNGTTYTISITSNPEKNISGFYMVLKNGSLVRRVAIENFPATINTTDGNELYITFCENTSTNDVYTIMVSEGSSVPEAYEPCGYRIPVTVESGAPVNTSTTVNIYLTEPLSKIGNQTDYIDFKKQKRYNADGTEIAVSLPEITVPAATNVLSVGTTVQPSNVYIKGKIIRQYAVSYYSEDGQTLLYTDSVWKNDNSIYNGSTPTKASTAQYEYSFVGWASAPNQTAVTENVLNNITKNKNVYAVFAAIVRTYSVYFYNNNILLQTVENVPYGGTALYTGADPEKTNGIFSGEWMPSNSNITGDTSCYAQFVDETISDSWHEIFTNTLNGTYLSKYSIGDTKLIDLGAEGRNLMQIVEFDADELEGGNSYAPITWISKNVLKSPHRMNPAYSEGVEGTGSLGGWRESEMRYYLSDTVKPLIPDIICRAIQPVKKYTLIRNVSEAVINDSMTIDDVWIPSYREIAGQFETEGIIYSTMFPTRISRIKYKNGSAYDWWLRTSSDKECFIYTSLNGNNYSWNSDNQKGVVLGFCTGSLPAYTINYYTQDGQTLINSERVIYGDNGVYSTIPTKPSSARFDYTFVGWSTSMNSATATSGCTQNIQADINVYAAFTETERTFTVTFYDGDTLLQTVSNVPYGGTATYTGNTPDKSDGVFDGWSPSNSNIIADTACYAQFVMLQETITDSWQEIVDNICNGTYSSKYSVGDTKILVLGTEEKVVMELVALDADDQRSGGTAPTTWVSKHLLKTNRRMSPYSSGYLANWSNSEMRSYLQNIIKPKIPSEVREAIVQVRKYTTERATSTTNNVDVASLETVWIPSYRELIGDTTVETTGVTYSSSYSTKAQRVRTKILGTADYWWLRSASISPNSGFSYAFDFVDAEGNISSTGRDCSYARGIVLGFCLGIPTHTVYFYNGDTLLQTVNRVPRGGTATYTGATPTKTGYIFTGWSPSNTNITADTSCYAQFEEDPLYESIQDTWTEIAESCADGTYTTKYQIGDTKVLDLGTEGQVAMQIVAFNADGSSSGVGKAPITWVSKQLLKTSHRMNPAKQNNTGGTGALGGWEQSEMRTYLNETIKPLIPIEVRRTIESVWKYTTIYSSSGQAENKKITVDDVWIPSRQEVFGNSSSFDGGVYYSTAFPNSESRKKKKIGGDNAKWWLRSAFTTSHFITSNPNATSFSYDESTVENGIALGFCTGAPMRTVSFYNGNTLLQTVDVPNGGTATYTGSTPTKSGTANTEYVFSGWSASPSNVTADISCYAQYYEVTQTITDSWAEIAEHVGTGDYTTRYSVGDTKFLDLGSEGKVAMEIVGIDTDDLADNSGKAPITWVSKQLLKTAYKMYPSSSGYTATWASSTMRTHLREDIFSLLPTEVQNSIKEVKKYTNNRTGETTWSTVQSNETVWIPSYKEIGGTSTVEASGITYNTFTNNASREKVKIDTASKMSWWLRSASTNSSSSYQSYFCGTTQSGAASSSGYQCYYSYGVALGFCTGVQTHTVYFYNGDTLLQTVEGVSHGGTAIYTGAEPTSSEPNYVFSGWSPSNTNITSDTSCYAQFVDSRLSETITDSWSEIIEACGDGTYSTKYHIGDTKILDLGSEGQVEMEIVGIDVDDLSDNSGKAPITWISKQLLKTSHVMYPSSYNYYANWASASMRTYLRDTILPLMPAEVQNSIKEVKKYTNNRTGSASWVTTQSNETVWIPSYKEVGGTASVETDGIVYSSAFTNDTVRTKMKVGDNSGAAWWLRSASTYEGVDNYYFCIVGSTGKPTHFGSYCYGSLGIALGFCL